MATSSTNTFNLDVDQVIEEAFERCGINSRSGYDLKKVCVEKVSGLNVTHGDSQDQIISAFSISFWIFYIYSIKWTR